MMFPYRKIGKKKREEAKLLKNWLARSAVFKTDRANHGQWISQISMTTHTHAYCTKTYPASAVYCLLCPAVPS